MSAQISASGDGIIHRYWPDSGDAFQAIEGDKDVTIAIWVKFPTSVSDGTIMAKGRSDISGYTFLLYTISGSVVFQVRPSGNPYYAVGTGGGVLTAGVWHHIAITRTAGSFSTVIYVDGVARASGSTDTLLDSGYYLTVGIESGGRGPLTGSLLAHARVWNAALSESGIRTEMRRYRAANRAGLLLDAPYHNAATGEQYDFVDFSGGGRHGDVSNPPSTSSDMPATTKGASIFC